MLGKWGIAAEEPHQHSVINDVLHIKEWQFLQVLELVLQVFSQQRQVDEVEGCLLCCRDPLLPLWLVLPPYLTSSLSREKWRPKLHRPSIIRTAARPYRQ